MASIIAQTHAEHLNPTVFCCLAATSLVCVSATMDTLPGPPEAECLHQDLHGLHTRCSAGLNVQRQWQRGIRLPSTGEEFGSVTSDIMATDEGPHENLFKFLNFTSFSSKILNSTLNLSIHVFSHIRSCVRVNEF